jgi:hypothetical protein
VLPVHFKTQVPLIVLATDKVIALIASCHLSFAETTPAPWLNPPYAAPLLARGRELNRRCGAIVPGVSFGRRRFCCSVQACPVRGIFKRTSGKDSASPTDLPSFYIDLANSERKTLWERHNALLLANSVISRKAVNLNYPKLESPNKVVHLAPLTPFLH